MSQHFKTFFEFSSFLADFINESDGVRYASYGAGEAAGAAFPSVQVCEDASCVHVRALLPGAVLSAISLEVRGAKLLLRGELPAAKGRYHRHERQVGAFCRAIPLPSPICDGPLEAVLRNGVLSITLPKAVSRARRSIRVIHTASDDMAEKGDA